MDLIKLIWLLTLIEGIHRDFFNIFARLLHCIWAIRPVNCYNLESQFKGKYEKVC